MIIGSGKRRLVDDMYCTGFQVSSLIPFVIPNIGSYRTTRFDDSGEKRLGFRSCSVEDNDIEVRKSGEELFLTLVFSHSLTTRSMAALNVVLQLSQAREGSMADNLFRIVSEGMSVVPVISFDRG